MPRAKSSTAEQRDRDNRALALRRKGASYADIAAAIGWSSKASASEAVKRALSLESAEDREVQKALELAKLDSYERVCWTVLERFHYVVITSGEHAGTIVHCPPEDGDEPLIDDQPVLAAVDRLIKISAERRKLQGLDAPRKAQVTVLTEDAVDAAMRALEEEIASADPHGSSGRAPVEASAAERAAGAS